MTNSIYSFLSGEALTLANPTQSEPGFGVLPERHSSEPSQLALIEALAAELEASEARLRYVEGLLTSHHDHCICSAIETVSIPVTDLHPVVADYACLLLAAWAVSFVSLSALTLSVADPDLWQAGQGAAYAQGWLRQIPTWSSFFKLHAR